MQKDIWWAFMKRFFHDRCVSIPRLQWRSQARAHRALARAMLGRARANVFIILKI